MNKIGFYSLLMVVIVACFVSINMDTTPRDDKSSSAVGESSSAEQSPKSSTDNKNKEIYSGIVRAKSLWVESPSYLYDYKDGFKSGDTEFLLQLVSDGKAFFVKVPTGVVCSGTYSRGEIIKVRFFEGRYKGKSGYIFADFVQRIEE